MSTFKRSIRYLAGIGCLTLQSCTLAPHAVDPLETQSALQRWNSCLHRFSAQVEHYCEGHRRDVLNSYPHHLQNHVSSLLSQHRRTTQISEIVKTSANRRTNDVRQQLYQSLLEAGSKAKRGDL